MSDFSSGAPSRSPAAFPLPPAAFTGDSRALPADAALDWMRWGWALFAQGKCRWCLLTLFFLALVFSPAALSSYLLGISLLCMPFFAAGWHEMCRMMEEAEEAEEEKGEGEAGSRRPLPGDLFVSFTAPELFLPGALGAGAFWLAALGFSLVSASPLALALYCLLLPFLMLPLCMALFFAPPLLYPPRRLSPGRALLVSFSACRKNFVPLGFFVFLLSLLLFVVLLSCGFLLPIALPVAFAAWRAACRDIFITL